MTNKRLEKIWIIRNSWVWKLVSETVYLVDLACPQCNKRRKPKNYKKHTVRFAGWDAVVCPECGSEIPRIGYGSKGKKIDRTSTRARYSFRDPDLPLGVYLYLEVADFTMQPGYL